ncbi:MAG TPA: hypothetical protein VI488_02015 [Candidatus Angelobacter sp.]
MKPTVVFLFALMLLCAAVLAQTPDATSSTIGVNAHLPNNPATSSAKPAITPRPALRPAHNFFDRKNSLAIAAVAASLAGDGWSTQRALALPGAHEVNPVARPFVSSTAGEAAYSSAGLALAVGGIYLAHKTNHHRWERIAPFALAGWEGFLTGWNLHQTSHAGH